MENLAGEIGALLGQELSTSDIQLRLTSKANLFKDVEREKTALTRMKVSGDQEGDCFLLTRIDTAITLGGTLIMLPEEMIAEHVQTGNLDGELADAFGEVANIIAGVFTQTFVDRYPKALRFIKESVEELIPTKVDPDGEQPFPPGNYHLSSCQLTMGEEELGQLELIVPAAVFELTEAPTEKPPETAPQPAEPGAEPATPPAPPAATETPATAAAEPAAEPAPSAPAAAKPKPAFADAKKLVDTVFKATISQVGEEIGALIGQPLTCDDLKLEITSKAEFFTSHCLEQTVLTCMKISGDREGSGYLAVDIPDAIVLGGTLIMLPEEQISEQAQNKQFDGEVADAYGEVANILSGGLTQVFLDRYTKQLRFVRTESEVIVPTKIDPAAETPFPEADYYLASFSIATEGYELQRMQLLFPAETFDLDVSQLAKDASAAQPGEAASGSAQSGAAEVAAAAASAGTAETAPAAQAAAGTPAAPAPTGPPVVLIISEQATDANPFAEILTAAGLEAKLLSYQDNIKEICLQHQVLGVFLLMAQVNEKGFATAIKLQSAGRSLPPMIFAGPEWTRSAVLRAVKYGARDILVLPASNDEIEAKVSQHILKAS